MMWLYRSGDNDFIYWCFTCWLFKGSPPGVLWSFICMHLLQGVVFTGCFFRKCEEDQHMYTNSACLPPADFRAAWQYLRHASLSSRVRCFHVRWLLYIHRFATHKQNKAGEFGNNYFFVTFFIVHILSATFLARIYPSDSGLSLWKRQDGELPVTARRQCQRQNQGRVKMSNSEVPERCPLRSLCYFSDAIFFLL